MKLPVLPGFSSSVAWHRPACPGGCRAAAPALMQLADVPAQLDAPPMTFEAQGDPVQAVILLATIIIPFGYWWYITVPEARLALAKDKRLEEGATNQFLQDLAEDPAPRPVERASRRSPNSHAYKVAHSACSHSRFRRVVL